MADFDKEKEYCMSAMNYTQDWNAWKGTLREAISVGRGMGLSDDEIKEIAGRFTDFLSEKVCAETTEEELLRSMWDAADEGERKVMVSIFFKMLENEELVSAT